MCIKTYRDYYILAAYALKNYLCLKKKYVDASYGLAAQFGPAENRRLFECCNLLESTPLRCN